MSVIRSMVVWSHASGLVEDQVVNTFHFNGEADAATGAAISSALAGFYNSNQSNSDNVGKWLSSQLTTAVIKHYDVTTEPSGAPFHISGPHGLPTRHNIVNLPAEVSVCLSFEATPVVGLDQRRRRGRIYVGPLNQNVNNLNAGEVSRPDPLFLTTLRLAAKKLAIDVDPAAEWVVYSRPYAGRTAIVRPGRTTLPAIAARPGTTVNIDRVWTDNAYDTQRRRGEKATTKTLLDTTA